MRFENKRRKKQGRNKNERKNVVNKHLSICYLNLSHALFFFIQSPPSFYTVSASLTFIISSQ